MAPFIKYTFVMCGVVGYIGKRQAYDILIKGLKRLEYRGYDSAGVALVSDSKALNVYKAKGKVSDLEHLCEDKDTSGTVGIAHTRWATHGEPSSVNAHPHYSESKTLAIIHNGIIENYAELKRDLISKGIEFRSDTDTEVLVQLIEYIRNTEKVDLLTAVQLSLHQAIGAYAIGLLDRTDPDMIIAARKQSPLVVGIGENEYFLASDASPFIEYTDKVVYLEDGDIAVLRRGEPLKVVSIDNVEQNPQVQTIDLSLGRIEKGGFAHFMLKEIFEQADCLTNCFRGRINSEQLEVKLGAIIDNKERLMNARRMIIVGCGTSWHAALIGQQLIERYCRIPVSVDYASEFRYRNPVINKEDVVIAISQSGETADTLAAIKLAKEKGAFVYGITNTIASSIARESDAGSYIHVGPEISVASTKAFTGQVAALTMFAMALAREKGTIEEEEYHSIVKELVAIPGKIKKVLELNDSISLLSRKFTYVRNFLYLGRGFSFPVALEGALKIKEIGYIQAEGYPMAEMKHGPISLVDFEMPTVAMAMKNSMYEKVRSNIQEVKARNGYVIAVVTEGDTAIKAIADEVIEVPATLECLEPLLEIIPLQLFAYHVAVCKGNNVDQPRNLAKSVTVE